MTPSHILTALALLAMAILCLKALSSYSVAVFALCPLTLAIIFVIIHPGFWLAATIALWNSTIRIPGLPESMNLFHASAFLFAAASILQRAMLRSREQHRNKTVTVATCFLAVLAFTAFYRGVGIRFLGSSLWGGASYVIIMSCGLLFLTSQSIVLSTATWYRTITAMCLLSLVPALAQMFYVHSGGSMAWLYGFLQPLGFIRSSIEAQESGEGLVRYSTGWATGMIILPFIRTEHPFSGRSAAVSWGLTLACIVLAGLSGYRSAIIITAMILLLGLALQPNKFLWKQGLLACLACLALLAVIAIGFGRHLPLPIQRAVSFIPWADIEWEAYRDASGTTEWRLDIWRRAISEIPDHLLIGKGLAFNPRALQELAFTRTYHRDWAIVTSSYHNGPLSLLIVTGLPGLLLGLYFLYTSMTNYLGLYRQGWSDPTLNRLFRVVLAQFITQIVCFLTLYGDVQVSYPQLFLTATILDGLARTQRKLDSQLSKNNDQPTQYAYPTHADTRSPHAGTQSSEAKVP